jgi:outer membrane protein assembly factor BamE
MIQLTRTGLNARTSWLVLGCALLGASGCVYRMNIQQGNFLDGKAVAQLQTGMTRAQVRYLLGTPMVPEAFDNERWDYLYYLKIGRLHRAQQRRVTVYFATDKVARIEKEGAPAANEQADAVAQRRRASLWHRLIRRADDGPAPVALPSDR